MHVGMIMDTAFPPDARVENEAKTLLNHGHKVSLFHIDYEKKPLREEYNGIRIFRKQGGRILYKLSALAYTIPLYHKLVRGSIEEFISETRVDVLHVHDMVIAKAVFDANKSFSLPVVLDLHENRPEIMKLYKHVNQWPGRWLINLERWKREQSRLMHLADHVILVTEEAREQVHKEDNVSPEKTTSVPNVVRLDSFDSGNLPADIRALTKEAFTILYIGDTSIRRGTDTALDAVKILKNRIPGFKLVMVGKSSQDHLLNRQVSELDIVDQVQFEGWQPPDRLPAYVEASDVCISPLHRNPHHDTTYANKLFQYMAGGRAVIVSDCPAQARIVKDERCGLIHRAGDAEDLAEKIFRLYENRQGRLEMGKRGAVAVREKWNWEETGSQLLEVYEKLSKA